MDRFSQQIAQFKAYITRIQIIPALLILGMLPGTTLFQHLGAHMVTSMFAGLAIGMLLLSAILSSIVPDMWAQRRATLISAALLAYACGTHIAIYRLALPATQATLFDTLAGIIVLIPVVIAAIVHSTWHSLYRR